MERYIFILLCEKYYKINHIPFLFRFALVLWIFCTCSRWIGYEIASISLKESKWTRGKSEAVLERIDTNRFNYVSYYTKSSIFNARIFIQNKRNKTWKDFEKIDTKMTYLILSIVCNVLRSTTCTKFKR